MKAEGSYVVAFRGRPNAALAHRTLAVMGVLTVPVVILHFAFPLKGNGVSLLGIWLPMLAIVLLQCRLWLHPVYPDMQIQVEGDTFRVCRKGKWEEAHRFSELTKVRVRRPMQMGGRTISQGKPQWELWIGEQCVGAYMAEMENSWKLDKKLRDLGLIRWPY